jgi:hypothetical protein
MSAKNRKQQIFPIGVGKLMTGTAGQHTVATFPF